MTTNMIISRNKLSKKERGFWNSKENQKKFLDELFEKLKYSEIDDWKYIQKKEVLKHGGAGLFKRYSTLSDVIQEHYPHFFGEFQQKNRGYWAVRENQLHFLSSLAKKFNIASKDEWGEITFKDIKNNGGGALLDLYHNSHSLLISSLLPSVPLSSFRKKKPKHYWDSLDNQRSLFDRCYYEVKFKSMEEWYHISSHMLKKHQILPLLEKYQHKKPSFPNHTNEEEERGGVEEGGKEEVRKGSGLYRALRTIYPNYPWLPSLFTNHRHYWDHIENHRSFFDQFAIENKISIFDLHSWSSVTYRKIIQSGGKNIINRYNNSLISALEHCYPELFDRNRNQNHNLDQDRSSHQIHHQNALSPLADDLFFKSRRKRKQYWSEEQNQRNFLLFLSRQFLILRKQDWYRISIHLLLRLFPSSALPFDFHSHNNFSSLLRTLYPNEEWESKVSNRAPMKSTQRWLYITISSLLPHQHLIEDYHHPLVKFSQSELGVEYDIFLPSLNLGVEYQGEQHFDDLPSGFAPLNLYQRRDVEKHSLSRSNSFISLLSVPYWWNLSPCSLLSSFKSTFPSFPM